MRCVNAKESMTDRKLKGRDTRTHRAAVSYSYYHSIMTSERLIAGIVLNDEDSRSADAVNEERLKKVREAGDKRLKELQAQDEMVITKFTVCESTCSWKSLLFAAIFTINILAVLLSFPGIDADSITSFTSTSQNASFVSYSYSNVVVNRTQPTYWNQQFCYSNVSIEVGDFSVVNPCFVQMQVYENGIKQNETVCSLSSAILPTDGKCIDFKFNLIVSNDYPGQSATGSVKFSGIQLIDVSTSEHCNSSFITSICNILSIILWIVIGRIRLCLGKDIVVEDGTRFDREFVPWRDPTTGKTTDIYFYPRTQEELQSKIFFNAYLDSLQDRAVVSSDYLKVKNVLKLNTISYDEERRRLEDKVKLKAARLRVLRSVFSVFLKSRTPFKLLWLVNVICSILYYVLKCNTSLWYAIYTLVNLSFDVSFVMYYVYITRSGQEFKSQTKVDKIIHVSETVDRVTVDKRNFESAQSHNQKFVFSAGIKSEKTVV